jgi:serpin B
MNRTRKASPLLAQMAFVALLFAHNALLQGCNAINTPQADEQPRALSASEQRLVQAHTAFTMNLFRTVAAQKPTENVFLSPMSAHLALSMAANGANAATRDSMMKTLALDGLALADANGAAQTLMPLVTGLDRSKVEVSVANAIWHRTTFTPEQAFLSTVRQNYNAQIQALDFTSPLAVNTINSWASDNTKGRIPKVIERIPPEIVMYLMNALYFKGAWKSQFDPTLTRDDVFVGEDGSRKPCKMMNQQRAGEIKVNYGQDFLMVDLPYGKGQYSMTVVLPNQGRRLREVLAMLTPARWQESVSRLNTTTTEVSMPKFKMSAEYQLNNALTAMGMGIAFQPRAADFTNINRNGELYISFVQQNTFVEVSEEGTEAAAVTTIGVGVTSAGPRGIRLDRPFAYFIREQSTGVILFAGTMLEPRL